MAQYQYFPTPVKFVRENPKEYIIPDCLAACKILWDKGIVTTQCSNYEDANCRWILIDSRCLSVENRKRLYDGINSRTYGFGIVEDNHNPVLRVECIGKQAQIDLCKLAESLSLQDIMEFKTVEEYLDLYKRTDGEWIVLPTGDIQPQYNSSLVNASLADALTANDDWKLYIERERRIYNNKDALNHHLDYLAKIERTSKKI